MDPVSILSLVSASLTVTMRAATIGKDLHSLRTKFQGADKKIRQLSVHVSAIRLAARSLSSWLEDDSVGSEEVEEIKGELLEVLTACCEILSDLQDHVSKIRTGAEGVGVKGSLQFIWDEDIIQDVTRTLHQQEVAALLILEVLKRTEKHQQRAVLEEVANQEVLSQAKRPSSSIFGLSGSHRSSLRYSLISEHSEKMEIMFSFDTEVMASTAYRNCFASLVKQNLHTAPKLAKSSTGSVTDLQVPPGERGAAARHAPDYSSPPLPLNHRPALVLQPGNTSLVPQERAPAAPDSKALSGMYVRALWDYEADDRTSLSFQCGDILQVFGQLESGWWDGGIKGIRGWFPSNYCQEIKVLEDSWEHFELKRNWGQIEVTPPSEDEKDEEGLQRG